MPYHTQDFSNLSGDFRNLGAAKSQVRQWKVRILAAA